MARRRVPENVRKSLRSTAKDAGAYADDLNNAGLVLDYSPDLVPDILAGRMGHE
jgi:hypothetical protein